MNWWDSWKDDAIKLVKTGTLHLHRPMLNTISTTLVFRKTPLCGTDRCTKIDILEEMYKEYVR